MLAAFASVMFDEPAGASNCPVTLSDFNIEGRSSNGNVLVYGVAIRAQGAPQAQLRISAVDANNKLTELDLPRLSPQLFSKQVWRKRFGWSGAALTGVQLSAVSVEKGVDLVPCQAEPVRLQEPASSRIIATYVDPPARAVPPPGLIEDPPASLIKDSDFIHKVTPAYPLFEREEGIAGDVVVVVDVRPDGKAHNVRVGYSSQDDNLDIAAAWAASHSSFKPPLYDGQPSSRTYKIEYDFMLDNTRKDVSAANIDFQKQKAPAVSVAASPIHWVESADEKSFEADLSIVDTIPLSDTVMLSSTLIGSTQASCPRSHVLTWDDTDGALDQTRFSLNASPLPAQLVLPVRFDREIFPRYPDDAVTGREEGIAVLVINANQDGKPTAVRVFNGSKSWRLDDAATQAAWLSTYPKTDHPAMYRADYDFELHVPGVKHGS